MTGHMHNSGQLGLRLVERMSEITMDRIGDLAFENARQNLKYLKAGKSISELRTLGVGEDDRAVVIAAGPSLRKHDVLGQLRKASFNGAIVATDSAMRYCLSGGVVPDLVVSVDPHGNRIVRWFGDPGLTEADLQLDDYFSRQDMDRNFADQLRANREIMDLLDRYGRGMRIALCTSASPRVVQRALDVGMDIYWWNPILDDPETPGSLTRQIYEMNGLPCVNAGGNVGTTCWMMAHAVLGKREVALTGMDFSYYADTPYRNTQYYREAMALVGEENLDTIYMHVFNPHLDKWFYTDPAYMWYRNIFLELAGDAECRTFNCTQGGILFGDNIDFVPFGQFLFQKQSG